MKKLIFAATGAAVLAACVTAPQRSESIEQARAEIDALQQDPLSQQAAANDLDLARKKLAQAESAFQAHQPTPVVDHLAYLARRHAEAGEARASEAHYRQEVAHARDDRDKILMEARTREANNAQAQASAARDQAEAARQQAAAAKSEAATAAAQLSDAQKQLADLQAKKTDRGVVVTLGDVLFDTGQATLKPGADLALNRLATYLSNNPDTRVMIEGHTDSRGSEDYNQGLSERRAQAVATALQSRGIDASQIQSLGRGKAYPVASNETPEGRQQNRRVEIVFSDASGRFAQGAQAPAQR